MPAIKVMVCRGSRKPGFALTLDACDPDWIRTQRARAHALKFKAGELCEVLRNEEQPDLGRAQELSTAIRGIADGLLPSREA